MTVSRTHLPALDGVRGVAAFSVMLFHMGHWLGAPGLAPNSSFAIDLFFCLSGLVLARAYEGRLRAGMPVVSFMRLRLVRLMPMMVLATLVAGTFVALRSLAKHAPIDPGELATAVVLGMLCLPFPHPSGAVGGPQVFPLNGPQYTLFFELAANLFWAASIHMQGRWTNRVIIFLSVVWIACVGLGGDVAAGFSNGIPRVLGSFYLGVALSPLVGSSRSAGWSPAFWLLFGVMLVIFFVPVSLPLSVEILWLAVASPAIVLAGSQVKLGRRTERVALSLGTMSYPLYLLHYPVFCWVNGAYQTLFGRSDVVHETIAMAIVAPVVSFAAVRLYDEPLRRVLTGSGPMSRPGGVISPS